MTSASDRVDGDVSGVAPLIANPGPDGIGRTASGNSVTCVRLSGNRIVGARSRVVVRSNLAGATGNRARLEC